jgi:hypothetical protein
MAPPMLALLTEAGAAVTGQRFIAVEWDERLGIDPRLNLTRQPPGLNLPSHFKVRQRA